MPLGSAKEDDFITRDAGDVVVCGAAVFSALFERSSTQLVDGSGLSLTVRDTSLMLPVSALPGAVVREALLTVRGTSFRVREVQDADTNGWVKVILVEA